MNTHPWTSGPEAVARLERWCAANGTSLNNLGRACVPAVHRMNFSRWRKGLMPRRATWLRLEAAMTAHEAAHLNNLLGA